MNASPSPPLELLIINASTRTPRDLDQYIPHLLDSLRSQEDRRVRRVDVELSELSLENGHVFSGRALPRPVDHVLHHGVRDRLVDGRVDVGRRYLLPGRVSYSLEERGERVSAQGPKVLLLFGGGDLIAVEPVLGSLVACEDAAVLHAFENRRVII